MLVLMLTSYTFTSLLTPNHVMAVLRVMIILGIHCIRLSSNSISSAVPIHITISSLSCDGVQKQFIFSIIILIGVFIAINYASAWSWMTHHLIMINYHKSLSDQPQTQQSVMNYAWLRFVIQRQIEMELWPLNDWHPDRSAGWLTNRWSSINWRPKTFYTKLIAPATTWPKWWLFIPIFVIQSPPFPPPAFFISRTSPIFIIQSFKLSGLQFSDSGRASAGERGGGVKFLPQFRTHSARVNAFSRFELSQGGFYIGIRWKRVSIQPNPHNGHSGTTFSSRPDQTHQADSLLRLATLWLDHFHHSYKHFD